MLKNDICITVIGQAIRKNFKRNTENIENMEKSGKMGKNCSGQGKVIEIHFQPFWGA